MQGLVEQEAPSVEYLIEIIWEQMNLFGRLIINQVKLLVDCGD